MELGYRTELASSLEAVEKLRPVWSKMQCHPNTDIDYYLAVVRSRSNVMRPHVVVLYKESSPVAILVARLEKISLDCKVGYFVFGKFPVKSLTVLHGGLLGQVTGMEANRFIDQLHLALKQDVADVVYFHNLRIDSDIHLTIKRMIPILFRDIIVTPGSHWVMDLPRNPEEFCKEIRVRHKNWIPQIKKWEKALNRDFNGETDFCEFRESSDVDQLCLDAEEIAIKTYQRALGVGFRDDVQSRQQLRLEAIHENLRGYILYVNRKPASFWIGSVYHDTFFSKFLGYDPALGKYRLGNIVFTQMIERLCIEGIRYLDFGVGDAYYKERFGDACSKEASIYLFAPHLRFAVLNIYHTVTLLIDLACRLLLTHLHIFQKIKTVWRRLLVKTYSDNRT